MERIKHPASFSRSEQTFLVMPGHLNASGHLFGGQLLSWIDMLAGIVAYRHADCNIVTAAIDNLIFKDSARKSDVITLIGEVTYTGTTSMEIRIESYKENKGGVRTLINRAYLVMVALDDSGKPTLVPELVPETESELAEWEAGKKRAEYRKLRRKEGF